MELNKYEDALSECKDIFKDNVENLCSDLFDYVTISDLLDCQSESEIIDLIEKSDYFEREITYYNNAMKYLMENDNSLTVSLSIANKYGYKIDKLNSEILASLLLSENTRTEFYYNLTSIFKEVQICQEEIEKLKVQHNIK